MSARDADEKTARRLDSQEAFVGSVTHSLKGALNGLQGGLYMLESGLSNGNAGRVGEGAVMIKRNVEKARSLVSNVLYYAKERAVETESLHAEEAASRAAAACREMAGAQGVSLHEDVEKCRFSAGREEAHALLCDLLELAIDQASSGGKDRSVVLSVRPLSGSVEFAVAHDGSPVEPGVLDGALGPVFTPFGADRSGLWLHAAKRICESCGGSLRVAVDGSGRESFIAGFPRRAG